MMALCRVPLTEEVCRSVPRISFGLTCKRGSCYLLSDAYLLDPLQYH